MRAAIRRALRAPAGRARAAASWRRPRQRRPQRPAARSGPPNSREGSRRRAVAAEGGHRQISADGGPQPPSRQPFMRAAMRRALGAPAGRARAALAGVGGPLTTSSPPSGRRPAQGRRTAARDQGGARWPRASDDDRRPTSPASGRRPAQGRRTAARGQGGARWPLRAATARSALTAAAGAQPPHARGDALALGGPAGRARAALAGDGGPSAAARPPFTARRCVGPRRADGPRGGRQGCSVDSGASGSR